MGLREYLILVPIALVLGVPACWLLFMFKFLLYGSLVPAILGALVIVCVFGLALGLVWYFIKGREYGHATDKPVRRFIAEFIFAQWFISYMFKFLLIDTGIFGGSIARGEELQLALVFGSLTALINIGYWIRLHFRFKELFSA